MIGGVSKMNKVLSIITSPLFANVTFVLFAVITGFIVFK